MGKPVEAGQSPFDQAVRVRQDLAKHLRDGTVYSNILPPPVISLIIGLGKDVLTAPYFKSIAIVPAGRENFEIAAGTTMETAQATFNAWASDADPRMRLQFDLAFYEALYGLVQIVRTGERHDVINYMRTTMTPLLLEALAAENPRWHSLVSDVTGEGEFDFDSFMPLIQVNLDAIWQRLMKSGSGKEFAQKGFTPENLFAAHKLP